VMEVFPQVKANVPVARPGVSPAVAREVERLADDLAGRGRILVRPSGTEPVVRILVESESEEEAASLCGRVAHLVRSESGQ
jgi:phosphoglucosamine mutase